MIYIDKNKEEPLYMQIYSQIVDGIMNCALKEGQVLQGSRGLAKILGVSRNTVDNAYNQLMAEGYITPRKGVGFAVMQVPKLKPPRRVSEKLGRAEARGSQANGIEIKGTGTKSEKIRKGKSETSTAKSGGKAKGILYDLTNGSHTSDLFPKNLWRKYTLECMEYLENEKKLSSSQDKQGELYLRRQLLSYLERIRGVNCAESQIIITSGIQQSLEYICKILPDDNGIILMEEPGFHKAAAVFQNNKRAIKTVAVDEYGLDIAGLQELSGISGVYTTPSHQFPTGVTLPIGRRYELLQWAEKKTRLCDGG